MIWTEDLKNIFFVSVFRHALQTKRYTEKSVEKNKCDVTSQR